MRSVPKFLAREDGDHEHFDLQAIPLPPLSDGHRLLPTELGPGITIDENKLVDQVGEPDQHAVVSDAEDRSFVDWQTPRSSHTSEPRNSSSEAGTL